MKLLLCKKCQDVIRLMDYSRSCECGESNGRYLNNIDAIYFGDNAVPIGIDNISLVCALNNQPQDGKGFCFEAFVIPKKCSTYTSRNGTN